jgi:hypothetical protein
MKNIFELVDQKLKALREADEETQDQPKEDGGGLIDISAGPTAVLAAAAKIPQDVLKAGDTDGKPSDEKVTIEKGSAKAGSLEPTQSEIGTGQSLDDQMTNKFNALDNALAGKNLGPGGGAPILTFNNKYVLDGHHRWSQFKATNPDAEVETANIVAPGVNDEKSALGLVHAILFALYGKSPTKPFEGENLFSLGKEGIKKYIMGKEVTDEVLQKLVKAGKIKEPKKELAAEYWANNLSDIKKGEFPRTVMPQTVDAGDTFIAKGETPPDAAAGKVNYLNPKKSDVKENIQEVKRWQKLAGIIK